MLGDISAADEIYIVCGYTDMRCSIDGLCGIMQEKLQMGVILSRATLAN